MKIYLTIVISVGFLLLLNAADNPTKNINPIAFKDIVLTGELFERINKNMDRMEESKYRPDKVFLTNEESMWWPGDTEGRTILALTLDAQVLKREPKYLDDIFAKFPKKTNKMGFFGDICPDSIVNEQQLSSHGWVLRALCEYYLWKRKPETLKHIDNVIENLVLKTKGFHTNYPIDPTIRIHSGSHSGSLQQTPVNHWILSTDIGCDHILLDGIIQAYEIRPSQKLKSIIEEMISVFLKIDQISIKAQTHATLTAMRGLMRWYEITNDKNLLEIVINKWDLYKKEGMTENFENYNWFGRPEWTEPCAVIDSYLIAVNLWKLTSKQTYIEDAHLIYYNGIALEQRNNGGFGIQNCSGAKNNPFVESTLQEAHWCCSMRGGEGLSRAAQFGYFISKNNSFKVPFYQNSVAKISFGNKYLKIQQTTDYPFVFKTKFKVLESTINTLTKIELFLPSWTTENTLFIDNKKQDFKVKNGFIIFEKVLKKGTLIELKGEMDVKNVSIIGNNSILDSYKFMYGPLIIGLKDSVQIKLPKVSKFEQIEPGKFKVKDTNYMFSPLFHPMSKEVDVENKYKKQILFREK